MVGTIARSVFYKLRKIRPLLDTESANVADRCRQPRKGLQRDDCGEQLRQVFGGVNVETALHPAETITSKCVLYVSVGLGDAFGMMSLGVGYDQIKPDGKHE